MELDLIGKSGNRYTYTVFGLDVRWNPVPANYAFVKQESTGKWTVLYIGQTENLQNRLTPSHGKLSCAHRNGLTHYLAHTNTSGEASRLSEEQDLIDSYSPICNG